ncbi:hypothetical protein NEF87_002001 [Candidatus Lokiarchaeum ossiferum]|uniref:NADH:ubiquinone oxidoreductase-like 20kDa subunit domain-containing protein n=1 Tax=Candidatus Lokiarchaeum ossiferum TaxID=2951803 RepID=A0ABY6HQC3_9ARCH|nr:hypothetical protein NEF87_002001 [Candidatus Lokiarchaeum sp. B-35]
MSLKLGIFQFRGCSKCFDETLLLNKYEIVRIPEPATWKEEKFNVAIITGYLLEDDKNIIEKISANSDRVIAFGSCTTTGGIFGLNYQRGVKVMPLKLLHSSITEVAGCLGEIDTLEETIENKLSTRVKNLCETCNRKSTCDYLEEVHRQIEFGDGEEQCFNDLGFMCAGYVAKECKERCIDFGAPCRACKPSVERSGWRQMALFATLMGNIEVATEATGKGGTDKLADADDDITEANPDVTGNYFRFTLADSQMPIGRLKSSGNLNTDIYLGRPIEELPLIMGCCGGKSAISLTLDSIEALEKGIEMEIQPKTTEVRIKLRSLEQDLIKAIESQDGSAYSSVCDSIRSIAGNMNLSNIFFGGFKTPIKGEDDFDSYKYQVFEPQAGTFQHGKIQYSLDQKGIITEFKMEA